MKTESLLYELAVDLNDAAPGHEFTTWSKGQLLSYVAEAVQTVAISRPDLFMDTITVKLDSGTALQTVCDCSVIHRVLGQSTADGRVIKQLRVKSNSTKLNWTGKTCYTDLKDFELKEYSIDTDTNMLWVYPTPPAGQDVYIVVECSTIPSETDIDGNYSISPAVVAAVKQWVLYRAKMVDSENSSFILQVAEQHEKSFWQLIAVQRELLDANKEQEDA